MAVDYGELGPVVAAASSLMAAAGALILTWKKRAPWEPAEEDVPQAAQRIAGVLAAVAIGVIWTLHRRADTGAGPDLLAVAAFCAAALLVTALGYGLLVGNYTYEREVVSESQQASRQKMIGGFVLGHEAKAAQQRQKVTIQELLRGASYDPDQIWTRSSRSLAKASFTAAYIGVVVSGTLAMASMALALVQRPPAPLGDALAATTTKWIEESTAARANRTVSAGAPLPTNLLAARTAFEGAWHNAGLAERKRLDAAVAAKALSDCVGVYRLQEQYEAVKTNALAWSDEAIRYFQERQDRAWLVEAYLDKAAIMLDLAQLENTSKEAFENVSRTGDALVTRAGEIASPEKKAEVHRISSRFYYNLARPKSFRLSDVWDNNYLLLAHTRAEQAVAIDPDDMRNVNQLLRATMKASKNPPQDSDRQWASKLRAAQSAMKQVWLHHDGATTARASRLSALNVLGTGTLETVAREWHALPTAQQRAKAEAYAHEIATDSLAPLREAEALLQNVELKSAYGFDIYFDISRTHAQRVAMMRTFDRVRAAAEFREVEANLQRARTYAKAAQLDAAMKDIDHDLSFLKLSAAERQQLVVTLRVAAK